MPEVFATIQQHCNAKPEVSEESPWGEGEVVWKRRGKIFAMMSEGGTGVTVKSTPAKQETLLLHPQISKAAYVGRFGWVRIDVDGDDTLGLALDLADEAYEALAKK